VRLAMGLPSNDSEFTKVVEFAIGKWKIELDWKKVKTLAIASNIEITFEEYLEIIKSYVQANDPNKRPQTGD
jgi:hypothetical protein